jgi:predicted DNA-binding transcriptional regulator AlpA
MKGLFPTARPQPWPRTRINPQYARIKDASEFLGISRTSFYYLVKSGELPEGIQITPKMVVWRIADLVRFAESKALKN